MGGILFGGPMGALAAGVTSLFEEASGDSIGDYLASLVDDVFGGEEDVPENSAENAPREKKRDATQAAALPAALPVAAALNRITLNPAAALGVAQNSNAVVRGQQAGNLFGGVSLPGKRQSRPLPAPWPYRSEALPTPRARIRRPGTQTLRAWTTPLHGRAASKRIYCWHSGPPANGGTGKTGTDAQGRYRGNDPRRQFVTSDAPAA